MNEIKIYKHPKFGQVRTVLIDGIPWFVGKDATKALGYRNHRKALLDHVACDDKTDGVTIRDSIGRNQNPTLISESGLYSLILSSKLETAKQFKHWITSEVLPSIRQHGCYLSPELLKKMVCSPEYVIQVLQKLVEEQTKNEILTEKCSYLDTILSSETDLPITIIAKDYGFSARKMNCLLHFLGVQYRMKSGCWVLYAKYENFGYTRTHTHVCGENKSRIYTCWTQKGRKFLYELLKKNGYFPLCEQDDAI